MWSVFVLFVGVILKTSSQYIDHGPINAVAIINNPKDPYGPVRGTIRFFQEGKGSPVCIDGMISGLPPHTPHGFHVHEKGDISLPDGCDASGAHFNPFNQNHGAPNAPIRHVGDLGNVFADATGVAHIHIKDHVMTLIGPQQLSILGRTIVVHRDVDDLGLGGSPLSLTTGNSGPRIGCGIIEPVEFYPMPM